MGKKLPGFQFYRKSPAVVGKEFWAHVLAYNLIRRLMREAGDAWDGDALG